jgi:hypothetical protein
MKTIYAIYLSEDGLWYEAYSNKKALWNAIETGLQGYEHCRVIETFTRKNGLLVPIDRPFTYPNLVKALKYSDGFNITDGKFGYGSMRVESIQLRSK